MYRIIVGGDKTITETGYVKCFLQRVMLLCHETTFIAKYLYKPNGERYSDITTTYKMYDVKNAVEKYVANRLVGYPSFPNGLGIIHIYR